MDKIISRVEMQNYVESQLFQEGAVGIKAIDKEYEM